MGSNGARALVAVLAVGVAIVLFVVLSGGDGDSPATTSTTSTTTEADTGSAGGGEEKEKPEKPDKPEVAVIEVKGGQPVGGVQELTFKSGETVRFDVESDEAHELHLHGYDVSEEIKAGGTVSFDVPADIEGVFELELEDTVTPIAEVTVEP